ncbi:site-specific integrase [Nocardia salmonicida]|uniref:tyrosine-type recombinase/integrase n=1 Tax=Nocardia salmonicida TaxID=53431 RepID=UPI0012F4F514|nr:tyrosine-type recombinase/integrase [Nocardia salmonicida]
MTTPEPNTGTESGPAPLRLASAADAVRAAASTAADRLEQAGRPASTTRSYASAQRRYESWCSAADLVAVPADEDTVRLYLAALADDGRASSTLGVHRAAIARLHADTGHPDPTRGPRVTAILSGNRREAAGEGRGPNRAPAATLPKLQAMVAATAADTSTWRKQIAARRDLVILTLGYADAMRRAELARLHINDLTLITDSDASEPLLQMRLRGTKTRQEEITYTAVPRGARDARTCPWCALHRWLALCADYDTADNETIAKVALRARLRREADDDLSVHRCDRPWPARGRSSKPLLRRLTHGGLPRPQPLSGFSISQIIAGRGLDARLNVPVRGHSLRSGLATQMFDMGATADQVMAVTRHATVESVRRYDRNQSRRAAEQDTGL